jgi:hypothetical protein
LDDRRARIMSVGVKETLDRRGILTAVAIDMKTIQTTIEVDEQRSATIQLPVEVTPGLYQAVVVIEDREPAATRTHASITDFPKHEIPRAVRRN